MCESINKIFFVFFYSIIFISCDNNDKKYNSWTTYGGDPSGSKYSSLDEINVRNVNNLKLLWTYEAFDKNEKRQIQNLKSFVQNWNSNNGNLVLVTHYVVILAVTGLAPSSGEIVITDKDFKVLSTIDTF